MSTPWLCFSWLSIGSIFLNNGNEPRHKSLNIYKGCTKINFLTSPSSIMQYLHSPSCFFSSIFIRLGSDIMELMLIKATLWSLTCSIAFLESIEETKYSFCPIFKKASASTYIYIYLGLQPILSWFSFFIDLTTMYMLWTSLFLTFDWLIRENLLSWRKSSIS